VDGTSIGLVSLYLIIFIGLLSGALWLVNRRNIQKVVAAH
jgi:hypothetical protein